MRKIRGWIKTLANASGPPAGTVEVAARFNDAAELDLEAHGLGYLDRTHQTGGAGSLNLADASGHFGWDMEFSPGPITTRIIASDPLPAQYRMRLPDESAQVGKAFHSDLERLGWTAGRDCLVWGAIEGVAPPDAASWSTDPLASSRQGDWSVSDFGTGADAGRVLLNKGIGFLGGVVFSIENPNAPLLVPVLGEDAAPANGSTTDDRWDLLVAWMDVADPESATYGKQGISIQRGATGSGIPSLDARAGYRQMVIHALKMAAGSSAYTEAWDLRPWNPGSRPAGLIEPVTRIYQSTGSQTPPTTPGDSVLNTQMGTNEILLSTAVAWDGYLVWNGTWNPGLPTEFLDVDAKTEGRGPTTETDAVVQARDYVVHPPHAGRRMGDQGSSGSFYGTVHWPLARIPAFAGSSLSGTSRSWNRLRTRVLVRRVGGSVGLAGVIEWQELVVHLWPVP